MRVTRTVNGVPVGDGEMKDCRISDSRVIDTLYGALRRAAKD